MRMGANGTWLAIVLSGALTGTGWGQGDPARAFDAATAARRLAGTSVRIDLIRGFDTDGQCRVWTGFCANLTRDVDCVNMAKGGQVRRRFASRDWHGNGVWRRSRTTLLISLGITM